MHKKSQKLSIQAINDKNTKARVFTTGSILAAAMIMSGCSPTEGAQGGGGDVANNETQDVQLLNVSYDVSRDFYKDYNEWFSADYQKAHPCD